MGRGAQQATAAAQARSTRASAAKHDGPITRTVQLDTLNMPVDTLTRWVDKGQLDLDAPYQRDAVWGPERRRALIRSMTMGLPCGSVFINDRGIDEAYVCVDGKQRIQTVAMWLGGELAVPASWFPPEHLDDDHEGDTVTFSGLSKRGQGSWMNSVAISVYRSHLKGPDAEQQEEELFNLINFGGVPQGDRDADSDVGPAV